MENKYYNKMYYPQQTGRHKYQQEFILATDPSQQPMAVIAQYPYNSQIMEHPQVSFDHFVAVLKGLEQSIYQTKSIRSRSERQIIKQEYEIQREELILKYPIPKDQKQWEKMLDYYISNVSVVPWRSPWHEKAKHCIEILKNNYKYDESILQILDHYENKLRRRKKIPVQALFSIFNL